MLSYDSLLLAFFFFVIVFLNIKQEILREVTHISVLESSVQEGENHTAVSMFKILS